MNMDTKEKLITRQEAEVMIWVKLLNDFSDPNCPNDTLDTKIEKFDVETAHIELEDFKKGLSKLIFLEILRFDEEKNIYELTGYGESVFAALTLLKNKKDKTIAFIWNGIMTAGEFIDKFSSDINITLEVVNIKIG